VVLLGGWPIQAPQILLYRVPLDKSEGSVKGTLLLSGAMSTAGLPEKVEDQGPGISRSIIFRWNVVPPTIDSVTTSTMILLCEHPAPCGMRERPFNSYGLAWGAGPAFLSD
jgi:hypothetical protein